jgi:hypothetical protein
MNLNDHVVYCGPRRGPLYERHPGRSGSVVRHNDCLHRGFPVLYMLSKYSSYRDSGLARTKSHDVPLSLQLGDALKLNPKLATLRVGELLEFAAPLFERRDCDVDVAGGCRSLFVMAARPMQPGIEIS